MRIIEGTVEEVVEYQRRMGKVADSVPEDDPTGDLGARPGESVADPEDEEGWFSIQQFIYSRARDAQTTKRVLEYLNRAWDLDVVIEVGESERSRDGATDYLMVRDSGPRRFGAVAYVHPASGRLTLRLQPQDVSDLEDSHIKARNVRTGHQYVILCPLGDDEAVQVALELTKRALDKVRK